MIATKVQQLIVPVDGNGRDIRKKRYAWVETSAVLAGAAAYTGNWIDSEATGFIYDDGIFQGFAGPQEVNVVGADVYTDQAGTLYLDQSDDQTANTTTSVSVAVAAATKTLMPMTPITQRYFRWRYVNGATPQTVFGVRATAQQDESVTATLAGSSATDGQSNLIPGMGFNETTYDRWRNNTQGTILASAARTTAVDTAIQTNYNARGVILSLSVTVASGTGGLTLSVWSQDPLIGGTYGETILLAPAAVTTVSAAAYIVYPGASGTTSNVKASSSFPLPRAWWVHIAVGDASSYTYSLSYQLIV